MNISIFLARIIGPLFCMLGIAVILNPQELRKFVLEIADHSALIYLLGFLRLLLGLLILSVHNLWTKSWEVIITLVGWAILIKGAVMLLFPKFEAKMAEYWAKKQGFFPVAGLVVLLIGAYLTYTAFLAR